MSLKSNDLSVQSVCGQRYLYISSVNVFFPHRSVSPGYLKGFAFHLLQ